MKPKSIAYGTYCNPLSIPDIPRGKDDWFKFEKEMFSHENKPKSVKTKDYRSISDPTVMYFDNKWYLYPSYGMCYYSDDFLTWHFHKCDPFCPKYSPSIAPYKGKFLITSWYCPLYIGNSPLGPFKLLGDFIDLNGNKFTPCDPGIFVDDDGRVYLYAFDDEKVDNYYGFETKIIGYELDQNNPCQVIRGPIDIFKMNPKDKPWERHGRYNQDKTFGWVEGPHLFKFNGRYYLIYASPDTCDCSYVNAVYYSDTSPLDNFICQKRNPLTESKNSLIRGAGHGCVERGPNNTLWAFYTIAMPITHMYERRIGMDQVFVDENKELYCPKTTSTPTLFPIYENNRFTELKNLTAAVIPMVSSIHNDHYGIYITDESDLTYWQPKKSDLNPTIEIDLGSFYIISSSRIWFRDLNLNYKKGKTPIPIKYQLLGLTKNGWVSLIDKINTDEELNIDYQVFKDELCSKIKLCLFNNDIGIIDLSVFGHMEEYQ